MRTQIKQNTAVIVSAIAFNYLFWNENIGLNALLFAIVNTILIGFCFPIKQLSKNALLTWLGYISTALLITYHGSNFAKWMHLISYILLTAFLHDQHLKSVVYAIPIALGKVFRSIPELFKVKFISKNPTRTKKIARITGLSILPLVIVALFYIMYVGANPIFEELTNKFWNKVGIYLEQVFEKVSFGRIFFFLLGLFLSVWLLAKSKVSKWVAKESKLTELIIRKRKARISNPNIKQSIIGLKNEYLSAIILMGMVNLLLVSVNTIDISTIWFGFEYNRALNLSQFVHEGTYLLILSILIAMAIILYFFRDNLNFYSKNKTLKVLSYVWIAQNVILTISVAFRNFHYINYYGLAYKRIGVLIFLIATIYGLYTVAAKIRDKRSAFNVARINTWFIYGLLVVASFIDWDTSIAKYNIANPPNSGNVDVRFLMKMNPNVYPLMHNNEGLFNKTDYHKNFYSYYTNWYALETKIKNFKEDYNSKSWASYTYMNQKAYDYFTIKNNSHESN